MIRFIKIKITCGRSFSSSLEPFNYGTVALRYCGIIRFKDAGLLSQYQNPIIKTQSSDTLLHCNEMEFHPKTGIQF
jgi:hypothetical protein